VDHLLGRQRRRQGGGAGQDGEQGQREEEAPPRATTRCGRIEDGLLRSHYEIVEQSTAWW
jgi:hypothetical protein